MTTNFPCPVCQAEGHDSKGDHLYLMTDGSRYCCNRTEYHPDSQFVLIDKAPDGEPLYDNLPEDQQNDTSTAPDDFSEGDTTPEWTPVNKGKHVPCVTYRGIPADTYNAWGCRMVLSPIDNTPDKVYYPMYENGKQVAWKVRVIRPRKNFYREDL